MVPVQGFSGIKFHTNRTPILLFSKMERATVWGEALHGKAMGHDHFTAFF